VSIPDLMAGKPPARWSWIARSAGGLARRHPSLAVGTAILVLLSLSAVTAPLLTGFDPIALNPVDRLKPPSAAHLFGTDMLGRDVYARTLYGGRTSLIVGCTAAALTGIIGLAIGLVAGFNRFVDSILMRVMDGLMAIPGILLAIALATILGGGIGTIVVATTVPEVPVMARLVRSLVLSIREHLFIEAARAVGTKPATIVIRHVLPNTLAPLLVQGTYVCGIAILVEAYLSFLGAGIPPELPSWGNVMAEGRTFILIAPWVTLIPGIFVAATVLALNLLGDTLRDLLDPRMSKRR
jgi:peptide/nickel transport system permease protein